MNTLRPNYLHYLAQYGWTWLLVVLLTQMPRWYEASDGSTLGAVVPGLLMIVSLEALFAVGWASLSYLLQWLLLRLAGIPRSFQQRPEAVRWQGMTATVVLALLECVLLGVPLGRLSQDVSTHPFHLDGNNPLISRVSILVETAGIMLAFPVACLAAGYKRGLPRPRPGRTPMDVADESHGAEGGRKP